MQIYKILLAFCVVTLFACSNDRNVEYESKPNAVVDAARQQGIIPPHSTPFSTTTSSELDATWEDIDNYFINDVITLDESIDYKNNLIRSTLTLISSDKYSFFSKAPVSKQTYYLNALMALDYISSDLLLTFLENMESNGVPLDYTQFAIDAIKKNNTFIRNEVTIEEAASIFTNETQKIYDYLRTIQGESIK